MRLAIIFASFMFVSGIFQLIFSILNRIGIDNWGWYFGRAYLTLDLMERTFDAKQKDQFSFDNHSNFRATGNEPFWGLIIDQESILFKSLIEGFEILNFPRTVPLSNQNWDLMTLISQPETRTIKVDIRRADCIDNMSGVIHPCQVKVSIKRGNDSDFKVFEGFGKNMKNKN